MGFVPIERLADVWPECLPWIEAAIAQGQGDENALDVFVRLARGEYLLMHVPGRFALVGQIQTFPRQRVGLVLYCGGEGLNHIRDAFESMRGWCRANGISVIRTWGRAGWLKVLDMEQVGVILQVAV